MKKDEILGFANSLCALYRLLEKDEPGIIVVQKMIDCGYHEFVIPQGVTLRGDTGNCGLKFSFKAFTSTPLKMRCQSSLESLKVIVETQTASRHHKHAAILVDETLVSFKNLKVIVNVKDGEENRKPYAAIFYRHVVEVRGTLTIEAKGRYAAALLGDGSAKCGMHLDNALLNIRLRGSICGGIISCGVQFVKGGLFYENDLLDGHPEFVQAHVYLPVDAFLHVPTWLEVTKQEIPELKFTRYWVASILEKKREESGFKKFLKTLCFWKK